MRLRLLLRAAMAAAFTFTLLAGDAGIGAPAAEPAVRILVLPIVVHSAAADASHVSGGLSDMLSSRLERTGRIWVDRPDDVALATTQLGDALREGKARNADFVVFGAFTQFGDGASLDIQCIPARVASEAEAAAARRIFIQSGAVGEIIPRLDEIADRVSIYVDAGGAAPANATPPGGSGAPAASDAQVLRSLARRLEALEQAVFGKGDASASTRSETPPES